MSSQSFVTLKFEVDMTKTAANVLFGYWSHDIGGFQNGSSCPGDGDPSNITGSELLVSDWDALLSMQAASWVMVR